MSIWTHVVGCIRVDGVKAMGSRLDAITEMLDPQCTYKDWDEASRLPRGSEGAIQYMIHEYDDGLPWVAIPIWGDLRDYEDLDELKRWFLGVIKDLREPSQARGLMMVRDAVLHAYVEGKGEITLTHDSQ